MKNARERIFDYSQKIIQQKANNLLQKIILDFNETLPDIYWNPHNAEDQNDVGIDFEYELIDKKTQKIVFIFKIQNKGSAKLKPLIKTPNKGLISFQISVRKALAYYKEINVPLVITICDTESRIVYWHAIQLDNSIEESIDLANKKGKNSIQIYIDPEKKLSNVNLERFFKEIKNSQDEQYHRARENMTLFLFLETKGIKPHSSKHLLDQVYESVMLYFDEFTIIPPSHLIQLAPIKNSKGQLHFYYCFKAVVDNDDFFNLIEKINSAEEINDVSILAVKDFQHKINVVLNTLRANLINYLENRTGRKVVEIKSTAEGEICNCCRCEFNRYRLLESASKTDLDTIDSLDDMMKKAYNNYKIGNYAISYRQFLNIRDKAKRQEKHIQFFLCQYNLAKLRSFMQFYHFGNKDVLKAVDQLKELNTLDEYYKIKAKSFFGKELLSWITEERFFREFSIEVDDIVKNIENQYESHLRGGWSNNTLACQLINELAKIESFLTYNHIIFDNVPEFRRFFKTVAKGLFCSHAIKETENSRLKVFSDFLVHKLITYGTAETLIEYFSRFHLKELRYESDNVKLTSFTDFFINNIKSFSDLDKGLINLEEGNMFLPKFIADTFNNCLVLAAMLNISEDEVNLIGASIVSELSERDFILPGNVTYLVYFIKRKGNQFEPQLAVKLLNLVFTTASLHVEDYVEAVCSLIHFHAPPFGLEEERHEEVLKIYGSKCPICNYQHSPHSLIHLYLISSSADKIKLRAYLELLLRKSFDPTLYYLAAINDIIEYTEHIESFFNYARPYPGKRTLISIFKNDDGRISIPLNRFIELCFKFNMDLSVSPYSDLSSYDPYYDWLLNMEEFDYSKFNPEWVLVYPSAYYLKRMSDIDEIKLKTRDFLRSNFSPSLEKIYVQHFSR